MPPMAHHRDAVTLILGHYYYRISGRVDIMTCELVTISVSRNDTGLFRNIEDYL